MYLAAFHEDEELAEMLPNAADRAMSPDSPSFREFDAYRYDYARIIALLEHIAANVCHHDTGAEPFVPVPAAERVQDARAFDRLESLAARGIGEV